VKLVEDIGEDKGRHEAEKPSTVGGMAAQGPEEIDHKRSFLGLGKPNQAVLSNGPLSVNANPASREFMIACAGALP
jgi:hypothetical protein